MKKVVIHLKDRERKILNSKRKEKLSQRERNRVEVLLASDKGKSNDEIMDFLGIAQQTILNIKIKYLREGLEKALGEKKRSGRPVQYGIDSETELTALVCSVPPQGRDHWTAELLMKEMSSRVKGCEKISDGQIRIMLKKMIIGRGRLNPGALGRLMKNIGNGCTAL